MNKIVLEWQKKHLHHSKIRYVSSVLAIGVILERAKFRRQIGCHLLLEGIFRSLNVVSLFCQSITHSERSTRALRLEMGASDY